ncbi:hypothetical protein ATANTOWER_030751, partial [Ataeniobius toweri]|nr:hypothetical protein [Ataeniobius toweri]
SESKRSRDMRGWNVQWKNLKPQHIYNCVDISGLPVAIFKECISCCHQGCFGSGSEVNGGDDGGLSENTTLTATLIILNNTVSALDHFWFLGTTISRNLRCSSHIDNVRKKAQQRL